MKVLVCGGRKFDDYELVNIALDVVHGRTKITLIISGAAPGADTLGALWAQRYGILVDRYPAEWDKYGKSAGYRRNWQMVHEGKPDLVVAFQGGKGTAHTVKISRDVGIKVLEVI